MYVEKLISLAKKSPTRPVGELIEEVLRGTNRESESKPDSTQEARASATPEPTSLEESILALAGELDALPLQTIPEYRRLNLISALRILDSKVESAVTGLSRSGSGGQVMPRPLIHSVR